MRTNYELKSNKTKNSNFKQSRHTRNQKLTKARHVSRSRRSDKMISAAESHEGRCGTALPGSLTAALLTEPQCQHTLCVPWSYSGGAQAGNRCRKASPPPYPPLSPLQRPKTPALDQESTLRVVAAGRLVDSAFRLKLIEFLVFLGMIPIASM